MFVRERLHCDLKFRSPLVVGPFQRIYFHQQSLRKDAIMSRDRANKIDNSIRGLISLLIPLDPAEDKEAVKERDIEYFELAKSILDK